MRTFLKRMPGVLVVMVLALLIGITVNDDSTVSRAKAAGYGVYIGNDNMSDILKISADDKIVVIEGQSFTKKQIKKLKDKGKTVYTYLNIGAIETYRSYYKKYKKYILGPYENWEDEYWIDVSQKDWQKFIGTTLAGELVDKGVDGFFVDNSDVYYQYKKSKIYKGLNKILERLRKFSKKKILINGGDVYVTKLIEDKKTSSFDGVNQETVFSKIFDYKNDEFGIQSEEETAYYQSYLKKVKKKNKKVYLLEYTRDEALKEKIVSYCSKKGYGYCISEYVDLTGRDYVVKPVVAEGLPSFSVSGKTDLPGNFFLSFVFSRNLIMLDGKGEIVWSKHEDGNPLNPTGWWDFKKHVIGGRTYYSYHDQTGAYDNYGMEGFAPGERVILDSNFKEIKRITFEKSDTVEKGHPLDGHDFLMIDPDHYIMSGYIKKRVYNVPGYPDGSSVVFSYLQEVDRGEVVWEFRSIDYPELYGYTVTDASETANDYANTKTDAPDYMHFNAMRLDAGGNLVCSFRHICSIMCLDRSKKQDQIRWKLSGAGDDFGLTDEQKTSCQHYVTVDGDYITVFNNENRSGMTRICSYKVNPDTKKIDLVRIYRIGGKYSSACGSAQRIRDELYMIGWGCAINDKVCMSVYDFARGEELFHVALDNNQNFTYRCVYY